MRYNHVYFHQGIYRHTVVSSCAAAEGLESGQKAKEVRGGRMQHRAEGDGEKGEEVKIPKP